MVTRESDASEEAAKDWSTPFGVCSCSKGGPGGHPDRPVVLGAILGGGMNKKQPVPEPKQTTPKGYEIPARPRSAVLRDFRKVVAPLRVRGPKKP